MLTVELKAITPDAEKLIEFGARVCYGSYDRITEDSSDKKVLDLIRMGHDSCLEHASATFFITGVSRALTHQLVRHRIASYSQRSQRYVKEKTPTFVEPNSVAVAGYKAESVFQEAMKASWKAYDQLMQFGVKAEDARFVLPNACTSEVLFTMNFRELRHFLKLRTDSHAQWEIREMAACVHKLLMAEAPNCFADISFGEQNGDV